MGGRCTCVACASANTYKMHDTTCSTHGKKVCHVPHPVHTQPSTPGQGPWRMRTKRWETDLTARSSFRKIPGQMEALNTRRSAHCHRCGVWTIGCKHVSICACWLRQVVCVKSVDMIMCGSMAVCACRPGRNHRYTGVDGRV